MPMTVQFPGLKPIPPMGIGTWQWGDTLVWGYGKGYQESDLEAAFRESLAGGVQLFDTAEVYGFGRSERLLGEYLQGSGAKPLVVSKFFPLPWRLSRKMLVQALRASLKRLQMQQLDLYLQHWPWPPVSIENWAESLAEAYELGLTKAVGVSNFNQAQLERTLKVLAKHRVPLAANQVEYSLLERGPETSGLKTLMAQEGVVLMAYSPLAMGWLTGKYSLDNPPKGGYREPKYRKHQARIPKVISALQTVAQAHQATPAQVALRWTIQKGTLPIPGAKTSSQVRSNIQALQLNLSEAEMRQLDEASA